MRRPFIALAAFSSQGPRRFNSHDFFSVHREKQFSIIPRLLDSLPLPDWPNLPEPVPPQNPSRKKKPTYAMLVSYNGQNFSGGYEHNPNLPPQQATVQGTLGRHLASILNDPSGRGAKIATAGRTDALVSAKASLMTFNTWLHLDIESFVSDINACYQSGELTVHGVRSVDSTFHASFGTTAREYIYVLPILKEEHSDVGRLVKTAAVVDCLLSDAIRQELDYYSLSKGAVKSADTLCTLQKARCFFFDPSGKCLYGPKDSESHDIVPGFSRSWKESITGGFEGEFLGCLVFNVKSNRFLRKMMRKLVNGVLMEAATILHAEPYLDVPVGTDPWWKNKWRRGLKKLDRSGNDAAAAEGLALWKVDVL